MKITRVATFVVSVLVLIQILPYGRPHTNPPKRAEPTWDSPGTRAFFFRACSDCHSNETSWPWYSSVAPVSWLVQRDVDNGRKHFNISEWSPGEEHGEEAAEKVSEGEMPLWFYLPLHPEAKLSSTERQEFIAGLERTFKKSSKRKHAGSEHEEDDH